MGVNNKMIRLLQHNNEAKTPNYRGKENKAKRQKRDNSKRTGAPLIYKLKLKHSRVLE